VTKPVILRPDAEVDVQTIRAEYELIQIGLGDRFTARLRKTFELIERLPELFGEVVPEVRAATLRNFPHVVYYSIFPDRVEVLAVVHGSRDESVWRARV
jgi:plasmid stabilization system protein ParE